jgi:hypothetical protein
MADNKNLTSQQDRIRIDINDPSEVEYVHSLFPELKHEQAVMEYLKTKYRV